MDAIDLSDSAIALNTHRHALHRASLRDTANRRFQLHVRRRQLLCSSDGRPPKQRASTNPPQTTTDTQQRRLPTALPTQPKSHARSVLIVDDAAESRELLAWQLSNDSELQIVGQAIGGSEAVELASHLQPDLVILDLNMPGQSGLDTIPHLFASAPGTTVVVLTSYNSPNAMRSAYKLGAAHCLLKGMRKDQLLRTLHDVLGLP